MPDTYNRVSRAHAEATDPFGDPSPRMRSYFHEETNLPTELLTFVTEHCKPLLHGGPEEVVNGMIEMFLAGVAYEQERHHERNRKAMVSSDEQLQGLIGGEEQE